MAKDKYAHCKVTGKSTQWFSADFTTARIEGTNRDGRVGMYSREGTRWAREMRMRQEGE